MIYLEGPEPQPGERKLVLVYVDGEGRHFNVGVAPESLDKPLDQVFQPYLVPAFQALRVMIQCGDELPWIGERRVTP